MHTEQSSETIWQLKEIKYDEYFWLKMYVTQPLKPKYKYFLKTLLK